MEEKHIVLLLVLSLLALAIFLLAFGMYTDVTETDPGTRIYFNSDNLITCEGDTCQHLYCMPMESETDD